MLPGHGVIVGQGADLFQGRVFEVLRLVDDNNQVGAIQPRRSAIIWSILLRHSGTRSAGQQLDRAGQCAGAGGDTDAHRAGRVVAQIFLRALALTHACVPVQDHHAVFQLREADSLVHVSEIEVGM